MRAPLSFADQNRFRASTQFDIRGCHRSRPLVRFPELSRPDDSTLLLGTSFSSSTKALLWAMISSNETPSTSVVEILLPGATREFSRNYRPKYRVGTIDPWSSRKFVVSARHWPLHPSASLRFHGRTLLLSRPGRCGSVASRACLRYSTCEVGIGYSAVRGRSDDRFLADI